MKRAGIALVVLVAACRAEPAKPLVFGTFNIRVSTAADGEDSWEHRRQSVLDFVRAANADVWAFQEVVPGDQLAELQSVLPEYAVHSVPVARGNELEVIFARRARFDPAAPPQSLALPAPDNLRVVAWWDLIDRAAGGARVRVATTHPSGSQAELEAIRDAVLKDAPSNILLGGDFNATTGPNPYDNGYGDLFFDRGFFDVWALLHPGEHGRTACGWDECEDLGFDVRIDWILATPSFRVQRADIIDLKTPSGRNASDHRPVIATVALGGN